MPSHTFTLQNDIEIIGGSSNVSVYRSTGSDPHFQLELHHPLENGWYEITIPIERVNGTIKDPRIYFDTGKGYNEIETIRLPSIRNNQIHGIIAFPDHIKALRFDPTIVSFTEFKLQDIKLEKLSQLKAAIKLYKIFKKNQNFNRKSSLYSLFRIFKKEGLSGIRKELRDSGYNNTAFSNYEDWIENCEDNSKEEFAKMQEICAAYKYQPLISIILPTYNTKTIWLEECINSVINQIYTNWELCVADDASTQEEVKKILSKFSQSDKRIKVLFRKENGHISATSNSALELAKGEYIALLDHDDTLSYDALFQIVKSLNEDNSLDFIYSDEDKIDENGKRSLPFFKPDWSPSLLYSHNYICHLVCIRKSLVDSIGGFTIGMEGSQDYDLFLRILNKTTKIKHLPYILYHWRLHPLSTSSNSSSKPYAHDTGKKALEKHLQMKYGKLFSNVEDGDHFFTYKPRFNLSNKLLVSIIIPTKDKIDLLKPCINSILSKSTWRNFEVIILNNNSKEAETFAYFKQIQIKEKKVKVVDALFEFNWSKLNNLGRKHAKGDIFIFLNNDITIITPDWIERLSELAILPDIGVVGALLLYEDNTIQHSGVVVGMNGWADHVFKGMHMVHYPSPFVSQVLTRNSIAVTGACMVIEKSKFDELGGFDEKFIICGSDVEICLRAFKNKLYTVINTSAQLYHYESKTRGSDVPENDFVYSAIKYAPYRVDEVDPFFNPNLSLNSVIPVCKNYKTELTLSIQKTKENSTAQVPVGIKIVSYDIPEIASFNCRESSINDYRINLIIPALSLKYVFGGINTALDFFQQLTKKNVDARIIVTDEREIDFYGTDRFIEWEKLTSDESDKRGKIIIAFGDRYEKTIPIRKNDVFISTAWWTAYIAQRIITWQSNFFKINRHPLIYLIQDFEPGFYNWSSRYALALSTYKYSGPVIAVYNSSLLKQYFVQNGINFKNYHVFEPTLNKKLHAYLSKSINTKKKKQIIFYGRPSTDRNIFEIIVKALELWAWKYPDPSSWNIYSLGEHYQNISLPNGVEIKVMGKLTMEEYANMLCESAIGISMMISPHPSYPPLEMAAFNNAVITSTYANKNLSDYHNNIFSLEDLSPESICSQLSDICDKFIHDPNSFKKNRFKELDYLSTAEQFPFVNEISNYIMGKEKQNAIQ